MKITRPDTNTKITEFDNIQEVVSYIKNTKVTKPFEEKWGGPSSRKTTNTKWSGTKNFTEALELLKGGWSEKAKEIEASFSQKTIKEATPVTRQRSVYDVVGGNCSVPRYLQGVPTSMIRQVRQPVKEKVTTINYNIGYNCNFDADTIIKNATECLSQIKALEDNGTRVNLNIVWVIKDHSDKDYFTWVIPVKKSSERISIAKIAFAIAHPSMLRRIMFALEERDTDIPSYFSDGYGVSVRGISEINKRFPDMKIFETKI